MELAHPDLVPAEAGHDRPLQHAWPEMTCYGCGPANPDGLHLESYLTADRSEVVARYVPGPEQNAGVADVTYGGLIASLVDCNSVWAAMAFRALADGVDLGETLAEQPMGYVTANLDVSYSAPTPLEQPLMVRSRLDSAVGRKIIVATEVESGGEQTASARTVAVAKPQAAAAETHHVGHD